MELEESRADADATLPAKPVEHHDEIAGHDHERASNDVAREAGLLELRLLQTRLPTQQGRRHGCWDLGQGRVAEADMGHSSP